jgi:signal transduction histidine kinase
MTGERGLRLQVGTFFGVVLAAFVAVNVVVMLAVWPQIRHVEHIYGSLGESLHLVAEMRGAAADLRSTATLAVLQAETVPGADPAAEIAAHLGRLARLGAAYEPLVTEGEEVETWSTIRDRELPLLAARALAVIDAALHAGDTPTSLVEELTSHAIQVDGLFQQLTRINASEVQGRASAVHASLSRLLAICVALLLLGGAGASLLLIRALSLVRAYAAATNARMSELDAFASRVAHDLRTPLQTIHLALSNLERRSSDEEVRTTAARGIGGVGRLDAMISDLLEFARSGATPESGACAELEAVFEHVREELGPAAERAGVRMELEAERDLWALASPAAVRSIVANLVENAIKYARSEGERRVDATARADGRSVLIVVRDTGIGIAPDQLSGVFDPFVRLSRRRDSYGLGLATVKRLVTSHGGTVSVESSEGTGTTFTVRLPRAIATPAA